MSGRGGSTEAVHAPVTRLDIAEMVREFERQGVRLAADKGQLRFKCTKGALARTDLEALRSAKLDIVRYLENAVDEEDSEPTLEPRRLLTPAPLAWSQLAHWQLSRLGERPAIRQIASAVRLRGRLDTEELESAFVTLVARHEALRTRIVLRSGYLQQDIAADSCFRLQMEDLRTADPLRVDAQIQHAIDALIMQPIDLARGPLLAAQVLKLKHDEAVLIVVMEHTISDAYSMGILLRELFALYAARLSGTQPALPLLPVQFADFAQWRRNALSHWQVRHGAYWARHLSGAERLRLSPEPIPQRARRPGWGTLPIHIGKTHKTQLREWSRLRRTTLVMTVFTVYAALILRWCRVTNGVVQFQSDGRIHPDLQHTIGFVACPLYLRVRLQEGDNFPDLLSRVTEEYCQAVDRVDYSYMESREPRPAFTHNPVFNWVPHEYRIDLSLLSGSDYSLDASPIRFEHPMLKTLDWDAEPFLLLYDTDDEIRGGVHFSLSHITLERMDLFRRHFFLLLDAMLNFPHRRIWDVPL
jgi:hypothetical protein